MEGRDGEALPVVVVSELGEILDVTKMNRKGYRKSTERGELWTLNEETGRLLPYREGSRVVRLDDWGRWYQAVIREGGPRGANVAESGSTAEREGGAAVDHAAGSQPEDARRAADAAPERATSPPALASEGGASAPAASEVIDRLERLVASRKRERPQGSYTTYLFDSGPEKIRKKTGEEAVELLLARDRKEIVSEAADFIYHLLVLLCDLEIPFSDVAAELERREEGQ